MKTILSLTALLLCALFLGGCMVLETGPCRGYGCPTWAPSGAKYEVGPPANAPSAAPSATSSAATTTKSTPDRDSNPHAGN
jgi:hypothetical protein